MTVLGGRRFQFGFCTGCRHFRPKRRLPDGSEAGSPFIIGFCRAKGHRARPVLGMRLEDVAQANVYCPDWDPRSVHPRCDRFDQTPLSAIRPYPECCLYAKTLQCPYQR